MTLISTPEAWIWYSPHHENEVAQSRCACGGGFARLWFHITPAGGRRQDVQIPGQHVHAGGFGQTGPQTVCGPVRAGGGAITAVR